MVFVITAAMLEKAKEIVMDAEWAIREAMETAEEEDVVISAVRDKVVVIAADQVMGISTGTDKGIKTA